MSSNKNMTSVIVISIILGILILLVIANYGTIVKTIYPPDPVIVSSTSSEASTRLFEYSVKVEAVIRNDGGNGDIVFEATVFQKGNSWTKSLKKFFESKETATMFLVFDEVGWLSGEIQSSVKAYSFGK